MSSPEPPRHSEQFVWHKTAVQVLERLGGYCATVKESVTARQDRITRALNRTGHEEGAL